jgi:acyl carrier protein
MDRLPVTRTGKVDRHALPPASPDLICEQNYVAPRNDTEARLAEIWKELLHLERIGVFDNFFEIGGHSLLATQVLSHVRAAFGVDLPLRTAFECAVIADLAVAVDGAVRESAPRSDASGPMRLPEEELLSRLDSLTEEQASALLRGYNDEQD